MKVISFSKPEMGEGLQVEESFLNVAWQYSVMGNDFHVVSDKHVQFLT
jgi:hypothetical protein